MMSVTDVIVTVMKYYRTLFEGFYVIQLDKQA